MSAEPATRQPIRRRPADRKQRIVAAAGDLFAERGYHNVSLAEVARAVNITAPALYRHFRNKQDLLLAVVRDSIDGTSELVSEASDVSDFLESAAAMSLDRRKAPILWQREARHLPDEERTALWRELADVGAGLRDLILVERPELSRDQAWILAWATTSVFSSVSFYRGSLPRRHFIRLLVGLGRAVAFCTLPDTSATARPTRPTVVEGLPVSTRENLLNEAVRLFDERGFRSVTTDEIGEAAGMSGPNIYKHFSTKDELLLAAVIRAGERRRAATSEALATAEAPEEGLTRLVTAYIRFASENRHLLGVLISELDQLPETQRRASRQNQRDFIALWVDLLTQVRPGLEPMPAKVTVLAALAVVDNLVRTPATSRVVGFDSDLPCICQAVLLGGPTD